MAGAGRLRVASAPEASGRLVAPPVFKTGEPCTARLAGSIPVRLRADPAGNGRRPVAARRSATGEPAGDRHGQASLHTQSATCFLNQAAVGTLPVVSSVKPLGEDNEHPGYANVLTCDQYLVDLIKAIEASPDWPHHRNRALRHRRVLLQRDPGTARLHRTPQAQQAEPRRKTARRLPRRSPAGSGGSMLFNCWQERSCRRPGRSADLMGPGRLHE
jgi:hypothetical protein